jgi:hypothetical protein
VLVFLESEKKKEKEKQKKKKQKTAFYKLTKHTQAQESIGKIGKFMRLWRHQACLISPQSLAVHLFFENGVRGKGKQEERKRKRGEIRE